MAVTTLNQNKNFVRDSGTNTNISLSAQGVISLVFIPFWIRDELLKNKLSIKDLLSFTKIKELFSYNDFIDLMCFNSKLKEISQIKYLSMSSDLDYIYSRDQDSQSYLNDVHKHIDEKRVKNIRARFDDAGCGVGLNEKYFSTGQEVEPFPEQVSEEVVNTPAYSVNIMTSTEVLVVFEVGFFSRLGDSGELNKFFAECLKAMYGVAPISEVNKTSLFRAYLNTL